jgi:UDP-N-acetylglucosamine--N-acetylmuramyl-(pentapeptide) pyrophosphoryl-undecaprenol N-acetylglucosamine transferase
MSATDAAGPLPLELGAGSQARAIGPELLVAGGGTGGHVIPAIEIAREWMHRDPQRSVCLVGTEQGLETKLVPAAGLPLETIRAAGLKGMGGARLIYNAALLLPGLWDSAAIVRRHRFSAALGVGGYASGPMMLAAMMSGIPSLIFEPNHEPGFTNRALARMSACVATAFDATAARWPGKAQATGCPVRPEFYAAPRRSHRPPFRLLITGGSQGALPINRAVVDSLDLWKNQKSQLFIVHQTGEHDYNAVRVAYARRELNAEVCPFIPNMAEQFALADLIVCRSGAITVAEVSAAGRAAIFIPFGAATDSHQWSNAQGVAASGAALMIPQELLTPEKLTEEIFSLFSQPSRLTEMEEKIRQFARPQALRDIVNMLEEIAVQP